MSQPLINYVSWKAVIPSFAVLALVIPAVWFLLPVRNFVDATLIAAGVFIVYSFGSRYFIASANRRGLRAIGRQEYDEALEHFKESYAFFARHPWLDRYRSITLMSPSVWSYREIALMNILTVHVRKKDFDAAAEACRDVLREFPQNQVAQNTYEMLTATVASSMDDPD